MFTFIQAGVLCKWTNDSKRFLLEHFDTIYNTPSHIYHSALPFSPSSSWLCGHYGAELSQKVKVIKGLPTKWGTCFHTVLLKSYTLNLSCWNNTIAVGSEDGDIIILDVSTCIQIAVLSGHTDEVNSLIFSLDGKSLVSGSDDNTIKLWDVQTGGVVRTFHGHTGNVYSVSISVDCTMIASGSQDHTVCLWDIQTGECHQVIKQEKPVAHITFSPKVPQSLLSISNNKVWQYNTNNHHVGFICDGCCVAFSSDGTQFVSCKDTVATVQNSGSGVIVAEFSVANIDIQCCCFSPDGRLVAVAAGTTAYVWDITSSEPYPIETFIGHTKDITSLVCFSPSSLISTSYNQLVKFWQIGTPSDPVETNPKSQFLTSTTIKSITLQAKDGITITSDSDGVVRIWNLSTGLCKASFQTPLKHFHKRDVQLINNRLISVWYENWKINIWDTEKGELLFAVDGPLFVQDLRISGDGSKVFSLDDESIQVWSVQTGEIVEKVFIMGSDDFSGTFTVDGSRVWVHYPNSEYHGWDFGKPNSLSIQLPNVAMLCLNGTMLWDTTQSKIRDIDTGKVVFQLSGRFANPPNVQCDGCFLVAGYETGEVLILDINCVFP